MRIDNILLIDKCLLCANLVDNTMHTNVGAFIRCGVLFVENSDTGLVHITKMNSDMLYKVQDIFMK